MGAQWIFADLICGWGWFFFPSGTIFSFLYPVYLHWYIGRYLFLRLNFLICVSTLYILPFHSRNIYFQMAGVCGNFYSLQTWRWGKVNEWGIMYRKKRLDLCFGEWEKLKLGFVLIDVDKMMLTSYQNSLFFEQRDAWKLFQFLLFGWDGDLMGLCGEFI